jgi:hypothetical protein
VITTVVDAVHDPLLLPLGALATIVYVPGIYAVVGEYGAPFTVSEEPAEPVAVIVPLASPLHVTFVAVAVTVTGIG